MKRQVALWVSLALAAGLLAGCSSGGDEPTRSVSQGRIVAVDTAQNMLVLDHGEIPGMMMAMTMPFPVDDPALLEGLKVGDSVEFTVEQRDTGLTVVAVEKIDSADLGEEVSSYEGEAEVVEVVPATGTIMIRATDIPGISGDGNLVYSVHPTSLLEGIAKGDVVRIKLEDDGQARGQLMVTELEKTGN